MDLNGKSILITGASDGIGAAMARSLHRRGARLSLLARTADKLAAVATQTGAVWTAGDVTKPADRQAALDATLKAHGRIDVLINNAGVGMYVPAWKADMAQVRAMYELNLFAVIDFVQLVTPLMRDQGGGAIVNVSSIAGKVALPWFTNYTASKFAVCGFTDALRIELKPFGISCMTVCPGYVKTGFQDNALSGRPPDRVWSMKKFAITPEECAEAAVRGIERDKRNVVIPSMGKLLQLGYVLFPWFVDGQLARIYRGLKMS